jgi:hypothetical protein
MIRRDSPLSPEELPGPIGWGEHPYDRNPEHIRSPVEALRAGR